MIWFREIRTRYGSMVAIADEECFKDPNLKEYSEFYCDQRLTQEEVEENLRTAKFSSINALGSKAVETVLHLFPEAKASVGKLQGFPHLQVYRL